MVCSDGRTALQERVHAGRSPAACHAGSRVQFLKYILDTNVCIALMRGKDPSIRTRFRAAFLEDLIVGMSSIVLFELQYEIEKSDYPETSKANFARSFPAELTVVPFSTRDAEVAGRVRAQLAKEKRPIGPFDTLIAGQALARGLTLVTSNVREFERVKGLLWEDWTDH